MNENGPKRPGKPALGSAREGTPPLALAICRLCQQPRVLRESHFIPAAFYRHLNLDETGTLKNRALQKLTRSRFARVPGQVKKHLLCDECEKRFSVNGESWVTRFGHQMGRGFRLQETLLRLQPHTLLATGHIYYAEDDPVIDWRKLVYFALSVFWRGAADSWARSAELGAKPFIQLPAALQEHLRRFLLGEAEYPEGILLMLKVSASLTPAAHMMSFPSIGTMETPDPQPLQSSFIVPGMIFALIFGPGLEEEWVRQGCLIRGTGHPVFVLNTDELFFLETLKLLPTATPSRQIIDEVRALWRDALRRQT
jgi:hypothetical protein